jgi:hypothetical protein
MKNKFLKKAIEKLEKLGFEIIGIKIKNIQMANDGHIKQIIYTCYVESLRGNKVTTNITVTLWDLI